jgi:hypothetical protein
MLMSGRNVWLIAALQVLVFRKSILKIAVVEGQTSGSVSGGGRMLIRNKQTKLANFRRNKSNLSLLAKMKRQSLPANTKPSKQG